MPGKRITDHQVLTYKTKRRAHTQHGKRDRHRASSSQCLGIFECELGLDRVFITTLEATFEVDCPCVEIDVAPLQTKQLCPSRTAAYCNSRCDAQGRLIKGSEVGLRVGRDNVEEPTAVRGDLTSLVALPVSSDIRLFF